LTGGDRVLLFPSCYEGECPPEQMPLEVEAGATSANVGEAVPFTVRRYGRTGAGTPLAGASLTGGGATASTDPTGHAQLTFTQAGQVTIAVTAPGSVRTEASLCVHAGGDGTCGTTVPVATKPPVVVPPYTGPFAL